jgi:hypothetical protein
LPIPVGSKSDELPQIFANRATLHNASKLRSAGEKQIRFMIFPWRPSLLPTAQQGSSWQFFPALGESFGRRALPPFLPSATAPVSHSFFAINEISWKY